MLKEMILQNVAVSSSQEDEYIAQVQPLHKQLPSQEDTMVSQGSGNDISHFQG